MVPTVAPCSPPAQRSGPESRAPDAIEETKPWRAHALLSFLRTSKQKILSLRGERVMLDGDLAALYGVETRSLVRAVKRNIARFPEDFMFQLSPGGGKLEIPNWDLKF